LEFRASPALSTTADVVMEDSMHNMAAIASSSVTSFLNINLACATRGENRTVRMRQDESQETYLKGGKVHWR
jgi:hypothetical protein